MAGVQDALAVLERAGFERLAKPLTVVGTEFDFEAAAKGTNTSHDLVVIATQQVPARRLQRLVAGLARSLDLASSRRPLSVVLFGDIAASDRNELERYARILPIESDTPDVADIERAIAVLLPLSLANTDSDLVHGSDPINEVMVALGPTRATSEHFRLIYAADGGESRVRDELRRFVNEGAEWIEAVDG
jgi:hypothetical protein